MSLNDVCRGRSDSYRVVRRGRRHSIPVRLLNGNGVACRYGVDSIPVHAASYRYDTRHYVCSVVENLHPVDFIRFNPYVYINTIISLCRIRGNRNVLVWIVYGNRIIRGFFNRNGAIGVYVCQSIGVGSI